MKPRFLENTTLHERQMRYYNGSHCPYCGNMCDFVDSIEVYRESYGMIYLCRPCKAQVGVHHSNTDQAYGFVAKKELRDLRHLAHQWFDPLWQLKVTAGAKKKQAQAKAREWLAGKLGIDIVECHIGMFYDEQCRITIDLCKEVHQNLEVRKVEKDNEAKFIIEAIYFLQNDLGGIYEVKEHKINNLHQLTLIHNTTGLFLNIKPREKTFALAGTDSKWKEFESVETLIEKYFKK